MSDTGNITTVLELAMNPLPCTEVMIYVSFDDDTAIAGGFAAFVPGRAIPTLAAESPALLGGKPLR